MHRFHLRPFSISVLLLLLFLALSSRVNAQTTYYVGGGVLSYVSGPDLFGLDGVSVTATATFIQTTPPSSSMTTSSLSTNTYSGVGGIQLQDIQCDNATSPSVTFTDNVGADDTISLSNCTIQSANVSATITIPNGNMITAIPAIIPLVPITGTVSYTTGGESTIFNLVGASIYTGGGVGGNGDPPPAVTFNPTSISATTALGSTTPISQPITFTTSPNAAVSFSTSVTTTDGGTWLSVPAAANTSVPLQITVNPAGLTEPLYSGTVTLNYGQGLSASIPVSLTVSGGTITLTALPTAMTFNYTLGATSPGPQTLAIGPASPVSVNAAVTSGNSWLSVSPGSGTTPSNFTVSVNTGSVSAGTLTGNIQITSGSLTPLNVPVTLNVATSSFSVQTTPLVFNYTVGGAQPPAQVATVSGTSGMSFSASPIVNTPAGGAWLVATASAGSTIPGSVSVSINTAGMTASGSYSGTVAVSSAGGGTGSIPVTLNVVASALTVNPTALNFSYTVGGAAPASQSISMTSGSATSYTAAAATTSGGSWLNLNTSGGTTPGTVVVSVNTSVLTTAGTFSGTVTITPSVGNPQTVTVNVTVTQPTITVSTHTMAFSYQTGTAAPAPQTLNIGGTAGVSFTASPATTSGGAWLVLSSTTGTISSSSSINVSVNTSSLTTAGTYNGTVTIAANGATAQIVNVTILVSSTPTIAASPTSLDFSYGLGGSAPAAQPVNISGGAGLSFTVAVNPGASWLAITPGSGSVPAPLSVSINPTGLTAGIYHGSFTISSSGASNSPISIPVTLTVSGSASTFSLSPTALNFSATAGGAPPAAQTVNVAGTSGNPVSVSLSGGTWLSASLSGSSIPATVTVSANPSNLAAGTYNGTVIVTSPGAANSQQTIAVQFVVSAATTITATPASLSFAYVLGGSNPGPQTINVTSNQPLNISTSVAGASWLTVTSSGGSTPATLTATVNPASLPAGTFQAAISITSAGASNSPQVLSVTLIVSDKPTLAPSPTSLTFSASAGGANPPSQTINLDGSAPLAFTVATSPSWLTVISSSSGTPATLTASVDITGLSQGSYQGSITISSDGAVNSPITLPVTLNVAVPLTATGPAISSIVNAASYDSLGFSPGAIITIFGSSLGPQAGKVFSVNSQGKLDNSLVGVSVSVEGVPAIPLYVQDGQINAILPFTLGTGGQADVEVTYNGATSAQYNIPLAFSDVQIFTANASGSGPGSILNQDGSINTAANPAAKGTIVSVYGTGAGAVKPVAVAGDVAGNDLSRVSLPYAATVNGEDATVVYAGTAPTLVYGVNQFNVQLPGDTPSGAVNIILKVGDSASRSDVTVFVK